MATKSRIKRRAAKRDTSMKDVEAGVKSGHETLMKILAKADPTRVKPSTKRETD